MTEKTSVAGLTPEQIAALMKAGATAGRGVPGEIAAGAAVEIVACGCGTAGHAGRVGVLRGVVPRRGGVRAVVMLDGTDCCLAETIAPSGAAR